MCAAAAREVRGGSQGPRQSPRKAAPMGRGHRRCGRLHRRGCTRGPMANPLPTSTTAGRPKAPRLRSTQPRLGAAPEASLAVASGSSRDPGVAAGELVPCPCPTPAGGAPTARGRPAAARPTSPRGSPRCIRTAFRGSRSRRSWRSCACRPRCCSRCNSSRSGSRRCCCTRGCRARPGSCRPSGTDRSRIAHPPCTRCENPDPSSRRSHKQPGPS